MSFATSLIINSCVYILEAQIREGPAGERWSASNVSANVFQRRMTFRSDG